MGFLMHMGSPRGRAHTPDDPPEHKKILVLDFDETLSVNHMYSLLTWCDEFNVGAYGACHKDKDGEHMLHPYSINPAIRYSVSLPPEVFEAKTAYDLSEHGSDECAHCAAEYDRLMSEKVPDVLAYQIKQGYFKGGSEVIEKIFGGDERVRELRKAIEVAESHGWEGPWVLSKGVQAEINTALELAGLDDIFPRERVIAALTTRGKRNEVLWPSGTRKCDVIQQNIKTKAQDVALLVDDDAENVRDCLQSGICWGVELSDHEGLKPSTLEYFVVMAEDSLRELMVGIANGI